VVPLLIWPLGTYPGSLPYTTPSSFFFLPFSPLPGRYGNVYFRNLFLCPRSRENSSDVIFHFFPDGLPSSRNPTSHGLSPFSLFPSCILFLEITRPAMFMYTSSLLVLHKSCHPLGWGVRDFSGLRDWGEEFFLACDFCGFWCLCVVSLRMPALMGSHLPSFSHVLEFQSSGLWLSLPF